MITSSQNPRIKLARALAGRPKERREAGAFLAEGVRLVEEALAANWPFRFALYSDGLNDRGRLLVERLKAARVDVEETAADLLQAVSKMETAQGILAVLNDFDLPLPDELDFVLVPDQVRDPGNLGTLIRTANAAGVQAVFMPPETADAFGPKVVRAGMGAHFKLPVRRMEWEDIEKACRPAELHVFLADMAGRSCWEIDFRRPLALIVGGEAEGASEPARKLASQTVRIPMVGETESLNAAIAGSILMFEVARQRT